MQILKKKNIISHKMKKNPIILFVAQLLNMKYLIKKLIPNYVDESYEIIIFI